GGIADRASLALVGGLQVRPQRREGALHRRRDARLAEQPEARRDLLVLGVALLVRQLLALLHELTQALQRALGQAGEVGEEALRRAIERVAEAAGQEQQLGADGAQLLVAPGPLQDVDAGRRVLPELPHPRQVVVAPLAEAAHEEVVGVRQLQHRSGRDDEPPPAHERGREREDAFLVHWHGPMIAASGATEGAVPRARANGGARRVPPAASAARRGAPAGERVRRPSGGTTG